jgi:hypothetical protein
MSPRNSDPGSDEHNKFMREHAGLSLLRNPVGDNLDLITFVLERENCRCGPIENGNCVIAILAIAIHISHHRLQKLACLCEDLVGCTVIDLQGTRPSPDVYTQALPVKLLLENTLPEVTGEEERVGATTTQCAGYSSKFVIRGAGNLKPNSSHSETSFS